LADPRTRESIRELINHTAHAAALSALVETANAYRFYFGVYVRSVSRFTPVYIGPDRPVPQAGRLSVTPAHRPARSGIKPSAQPDNGTALHKNVAVAERNNQTHGCIRTWPCRLAALAGASLGAIGVAGTNGCLTLRRPYD
jgi:hypothetical protein